MHNKTQQCRYPEETNWHRLLVTTNPKDSGAPFIVKQDGIYQLAGLHKGKAIIPNIELPEEGFVPALSLIVPLYPYIQWIQETVNTIS
jgi:hypothetical protein